MTAQDDGIFGIKKQVFVALGQGDTDLAGNGVRIFSRLVEDLSFQHGQNVEKRHLIQHAKAAQGHIIAGDILP